jgi:transposase InsO family protein
MAQCIRPLQHLQIDCFDIETDPISGHRVVLTVVDLFTKMVWGESFASKHADLIATFLITLLTRLISEGGEIEKIQSDNGKEFIAEVVKKVIKAIEVLEAHCKPYWLRGNGGAERVNQTIQDDLSKATIGHEWSHLLLIVILNYNKMKHSTTGISPLEAFRITNLIQL